MEILHTISNPLNSVLLCFGYEVPVTGKLNPPKRCWHWHSVCVTMFCFVFFHNFLLQIELQSSCSIKPPANWTCQKCFPKYHDWVDDAHCSRVSNDGWLKSTYLMEWDLGHLSDVVLSLVTLQDLCLDGVGEACRKVKLTGWSNWIVFRKFNYFICCLRDLFLFWNEIYQTSYVILPFPVLNLVTQGLRGIQLNRSSLWSEFTHWFHAKVRKLYGFSYQKETHFVHEKMCFWHLRIAETTPSHPCRRSVTLHRLKFRGNKCSSSRLTLSRNRLIRSSCSLERPDW